MGYALRLCVRLDVAVRCVQGGGGHPLLAWFSGQEETRLGTRVDNAMRRRFDDEQRQQIAALRATCVEQDQRRKAAEFNDFVRARGRVPVDGHRCGDEERRLGKWIRRQYHRLPLHLRLEVARLVAKLAEEEWQMWQDMVDTGDGPKGDWWREDLGRCWGSAAALQSYLARSVTDRARSHFAHRPAEEDEVWGIGRKTFYPKDSYAERDYLLDGYSKDSLPWLRAADGFVLGQQIGYFKDLSVTEPVRQEFEALEGWATHKRPRDMFVKMEGRLSPRERWTEDTTLEQSVAADREEQEVWAYSAARHLGAFQLQHCSSWSALFGTSRRVRTRDDYMDMLWAFLLRLLALLDGKRSGRPTFPFRCHDVVSREVFTGWAYTYKNAPRYNFIQFGPELFPEWHFCFVHDTVATLTENAAILRRCKFFRSSSWANYSCSKVQSECWPTWQTRFLLKPYYVEPAPTLTQAIQSVLDTEAVVAAEAAEGLAERALGTVGWREVVSTAVERAKRKDDRIKRSRRYVGPEEAGSIVELPWALSDGRWAAATPVCCDLSGASGQTANGASLALIYLGKGPYSRNFSECLYAYRADVQHALNNALYDEETWLCTDFLCDDDPKAVDAARRYHDLMADVCAQDVYRQRWCLRQQRALISAREQAEISWASGGDSFDNVEQFRHAEAFALPRYDAGLGPVNVHRYNYLHSLALSSPSIHGICCVEHPSCAAFHAVQSSRWEKYHRTSADDMYAMLGQQNAHVVTYYERALRIHEIHIALFGCDPPCCRLSFVATRRYTEGGRAFVEVGRDPELDDPISFVVAAPVHKHDQNEHWDPMLTEDGTCDSKAGGDDNEGDENRALGEDFDRDAEEDGDGVTENLDCELGSEGQEEDLRRDSWMGPDGEDWFARVRATATWLDQT